MIETIQQLAFSAFQVGVYLAIAAGFMRAFQ
jgi:hypothetical protein